jgi:hypothetical protein
VLYRLKFILFLLAANFVVFFAAYQLWKFSPAVLALFTVGAGTGRSSAADGFLE